jgi:DNA polymerase III subunit epsilon
MTSQRYVICDIEATGLHADKEMIEIALISFQDGKIVEVYQSLINPLGRVSDFIQDLTSISLRELDQAPKFYEVADAIRLRLENSIFVSHNTDFDYLLLQKKFQELGQDLKLKTFCTLKVAQQEIPGLRNYNLDALCSFFGIKVEERHRAEGDAQATLRLFLELLKLRHKGSQKVLYLPHHEKLLKKIPARAGLLKFVDSEGLIFHYEAAFNMERRARELLTVKQENRNFLESTEMVQGEVTGSMLIAEFQKLHFKPFQVNWTIISRISQSGEKYFSIRPMKKGFEGIWFFKSYTDAKIKLKLLSNSFPKKVFAYREGGKSKEEILKHNQHFERLARDGRFPTDNLILIGEGRELGEKALILVRNNHVKGYGYTYAANEEILADPEKYLLKNFHSHLGADTVARKYLQILKNLKHKTEGWQGLGEVR